MADKKTVVTLAGLSRRKQKKVADRLVKEVMNDKAYRRAVEKTNKSISREAAEMAARVAVDSALGRGKAKEVTGAKKKKADEVKLGRSGLDIYTDLVRSFAKARKNHKKNAKKRAKLRAKKWKKCGGKFKAKTGLVLLMKAAKLVKIKKAKRLKAYKPKKKK